MSRPITRLLSTRFVLAAAIGVGGSSELDLVIKTEPRNQTPLVVQKRRDFGS